MTTAIYYEFRFEAAHALPNVPAVHPCARLHGHSFRARITVAGRIDPVTGWIMDFATIASAVEPVRQQLDHRFLNEIPGLENPTSELVASWIWTALKPSLPDLTSIELSETEGSGCIIHG
ncbi:MAG: 6-carboxy-5,6,7,8-tetrahydropterin synthase [Gemmatimonadaceae bacterium]|nr:6-carboxy-5,6,7,8-tetrahydropterin synthase [Gemmatimonadaceae bacterium]